MAPNNILKELEGVNFSCSSDLAASSTTCAVDEQHSSMLTSLGSSGRAIDRFSPHLRDPLRARSLNPELMTQYSPATTTTTTTTTNNNNNKPKLSASSSSSSRSSRRKQQQVIISPASSSRYLLSGSASDVDVQLWDSTQAPAAVDVSEAASEAWRFQSSAAKVLQSSTVVKAEIDPSTFQSINLEQSTTTTTTHDDPDSSSSSSSSSCSNSSSRPQNHQVVVLKVSLHCKGCELKVRKHLSKMEGVTSFTTDLVNKKVTVVGDVTPLGVLNSISKVKNAQLWRSLPPTSSSSSSSTKILSYS